MTQQLKKSAAWQDIALSTHERAVAARDIVERLIARDEPVALFLDIDGTLLDVALTPSTVHVPPNLSQVLQALASRLHGALAIVTGRPLDEADHLLHPAKLVGGGVHGGEMRLSVNGSIEALTSMFSPVLTADIKKIVEDLPGIVYEDKGSGIALHYRLAPELHSSLMMMIETLVPKYPNEFSICAGRKVVEVLPIGFSKGRALRKLASLPLFANKIPIMIGDDIADVDAFRAAEELGGFGLKVAGENFSAAESAFQGPAEVLDWLQKFAELDAR
ncbi:trehalose-phosphatase [Hyphomicrobium sp. 99]|uniref:trehalose-phosphatase n=1 Tax=Hyphomicrobium sp. 99 TaxID=1163419 RepID=UPI001FDA4850|nr:trehalose-phosphatase [Hyphomicrobium sp. 99]